ncbi:macrolide-efflux protein [Lachnospiraceae bacterium KM106-2]|nr:macrolide-efflux protein [Lachnospiraceae bacterium KM106-2]
MLHQTKENKQGPSNPLWTKNFTIITVGTVISRLGNSISGFATGLLVLDYTASTFLYALYMVLYNLPKIILPSLAGPFIDKFSRRKTIYTLDFISTGIYFLFALIILTGNLSYIFLIIGCMILGAIDSVYQVAYESFYPMLVSKGNYTKAYSIDSTLDSLTMLMVPVSAFLYNLVGIGPLFLIDMISFLVAAIFETQIQIEESYVKKEEESFGFKQYKKTFSDGINYLKKEKGLLAITMYFTVTMFAQGASNVIGLPYFKSTYSHGEYVYIAVMGFMLAGRIFGGVIHYKFKYPTDKKFTIALIVYMTISIIDGSYLYMPIVIMMGMCFLSGIMGVTSYNIRISATQSYVPDGNKGRFNGIFQMLITIGMMLGELSSGIMGDFMEKRLVIALFMMLNFIGVWFIMYRKRSHVKPIYNRQA